MRCSIILFWGLGFFEYPPSLYGGPQFSVFFGRFLKGDLRHHGIYPLSACDCTGRRPHGMPMYGSARAHDPIGAQILFLTPAARQASLLQQALSLCLSFNV